MFEVRFMMSGLISNYACGMPDVTIFQQNWVRASLVNLSKGQTPILLFIIRNILSTFLIAQCLSAHDEINK